MPTPETIVELFEGRECGADDGFRRQYKRIFKLRFASINVGQSYALWASGLPKPYDPYEGPSEIDYGSRAIRCRAVQDPNDGFVWTVTIDYDSVSSDPAIATQSGGSGGSGGAPPNENPLLDPPRISFGAIHDTKVLDRSYTMTEFGIRRAILNSARQPFQPRPTVDVHRATLTYIRNEATEDTSQVYWDRVNESTFAGFPARSLKLNYVTAELSYRNATPYWVKTYYFESRFPDWDFHLLDQGTKELIDNVPTRIVQNAFESGQTLLNGSGARANVDANGVPTPFIMDYEAYQDADFNDLNLNGL